jgi:hypothetical protein
MVIKPAERRINTEIAGGPKPSCFAIHGSSDSARVEIIDRTVAANCHAECSPDDLRHAKLVEASEHPDGRRAPLLRSAIAGWLIISAE